MSFNDNCCVKVDKRNESCEYLSLGIYDDYISFCRYVVPGRCDIYFFKVEYKDRLPFVKFFSDCKVPIQEAVRMFKRDLKKKCVQEVIASARLNKSFNWKIDNFFKLFNGDEE